MEGAEQWVTRQWSEITRPSADCKTTFLDVSSHLEEHANKKFFERRHWTVTRQWSEVTRPSADCQTTFFGRFKPLGNFLKEVTERSRDCGRKSRDRRPTVKQRFWTFQAIRKIFVKCHWTVTRQWTGVMRQTADCQTTFFVRFKQLGKILKNVPERSRDSGRRSRDRRPTVKQRFFDVSSNRETFCKKWLNGHATVVWGHATVGDCQAHICMYIFMNKREKERSAGTDSLWILSIFTLASWIYAMWPIFMMGEERERKREREREEKREREYLAGSCYLQ